MILFFCQNRASREYFQKLTRHFSLPWKITRSSTLRLPNINALINFDRAFAAGLLQQQSREYKVLHKKPMPQWLRRVELLKIRWLLAEDTGLLLRVQPVLVVVWNGLKYRRAIFSQAAKSLNIQCVYMENGLLPHTTVCDKKGVNALNSMPRDADFYLQRPMQKSSLQQSSFATELVARESKGKKQVSGASLPEKYIFVPFQVDTDSQILLFSPWLPTMAELFAVMRRAASDIDGLQLVFKEHPSSTINYSYLHDQLPESEGIFANDYSTQELIENAEVVVTINSTVGIESVLLGKKVITLGEAFFNIPGLVFPVQNQQQLGSLLLQLDELTPDAQLRVSFLDYLANNYLLQGSWREADDAHCKQAAQRLEQFYNESL